MPLEDGSTISHLDQANPTSQDEIAFGDDHLRLIKKVLKQQFPGENGQGFNVPITATEQEINHLSGVKGNIQNQIDAIIVGGSNTLNAPPGTTMLFRQNTPPIGWTKLTAQHNRMLRIVNTNVGEGGNSDPTNWQTVHNHDTKDHALTVRQMARHAHAMFGEPAPGNKNQVGVFEFTAVQWSPDNNQGYNMQATGNTTDPTRGATGIGGFGEPHNHGTTTSKTLTFKPRYYDVIVAEKDND